VALSEGVAGGGRGRRIHGESRGGLEDTARSGPAAAARASRGTQICFFLSPCLEENMPR
jgi:hypothetical protein